jgi:8-oxo-dGTP pyrophosphatase MutT (NUDIX family)
MPSPIKIFIRDIALYLSEAPLSGSEMLDDSAVRPDMVEQIIEKSKKSGKKAFTLISSDPPAAYKKIQEVLRPVRSAGGVVWNTESHLLMIYRRGKWDLPKGKVEDGESLETAAIREVEEESGIGKLRLLEKFDISYHIYYEVDSWVIKETHWFEMLSHDNGSATPQESEGITQVKWVARNKIEPKLKNTYPSIYDLITRALEEGYKVATID